MELFSSKRQQILSFIVTFIDGRGYAPSVRDIAERCGISSSSVVQHHPNALEREGYIHRDRGISRSIRVTRLNDN